VEVLRYATIVLSAYLLGSIPTGYLLAQFRGVDIRQVGSGNIGATNVFRILGKTAGTFVLLADALKGFIACYSLGGIAEELFRAEVNQAAAMMRALGVTTGDRVVIYMPNIPEAVFAILIAGGIGYWADGRFGTSPWLLIVGFVIGFGSFVLRLFRLGRRLNATVPPVDSKPGGR
jgi:acyl-phosphate glycerol 3-phosphate acyltransferase